MPDREAIVCFGGYDYWNSNPGSPVQLMEAAHARGHRILWINNIGMNMPRLRKSGFFRRVGLKLKSWARWLGRARTDFFVLTPIILPLFGKPLLEKWNERWLLFQIRLAYRLLGLKRPLAVVCIPSFGAILPKLDHSSMIYYYTDKFDSYRDIKAKESIQRRDRITFETADLVLCSSRLIYDECRAKREGVSYFPHAVDFERFDAVLKADTIEPADIAAIEHPRIGYFGSLTDSNDLELVRYCAVEDPSLHFVLIGRVLGDYSSISVLPNVHLLGMKPYEEIPLYGKYFDVGFMNWKLTEWIRHSSPVKTKEYLGLGLPVVSVPIEELEREYEGLVDLASNGPEFLAAIRKALAEDNSDLREQRRDRVRGDSWPAQLESMFTDLEGVRRGD
jgi:hypothetical protein